MAGSIAFLLVILLSSSAIGQVALRTFANVETAGIMDTLLQNSHVRKWYFYYDDNGVLDSLVYQGDYLKVYQGLTKSKPFVRDVPRSADLPPNSTPMFLMDGKHERHVITEAEVGTIKVVRYGIQRDRPDSVLDTTVYVYDPSSGRLLRNRSHTYDYAFDTDGRIKSVTLFSRGRLAYRWQFTRDHDGTIIAAEQLQTRFRNDSLVTKSFWQILKWQPTVSAQSAPAFDRWFDSERFPYLPEGQPAVWIYTNKGFSGKWGKSTLHEEEYDSLDRLIRDESPQIRSVQYHPSGVIERERHTRIPPMYEADRTLYRKMGADGLYWSDFAEDLGRGWFEHRVTLYDYEYAFRYSDGLFGDRYAKHIWYRGKDTLNLTIDEALPTEGLTACVIDTTEREIVQIPLTGRKTTFILPALAPRMLHAIRWKYRGRKIVDQVF